MPQVIEWRDDFGTDMVWRWPGGGEIQWGAQLVVMESQAAVFFRDGKALDTFGAGRHTLTTANLPLLTRLLAIPFGGRSPFRAEVYYVSTKVFSNLKWGTKEPILLRDPELAMVRLRGFGSFSVRVAEPQLFVNKLVGTQSIYEQSQVEEYFRNILVARLADIVGELAKSVFDLPRLYDEIAVAAKTRVAGDFESYGLQLVDFVVQSFSLPEEVQKIVDERTGMAAIGDMRTYTQFKAARAMEAAAQSGGGAGEGLGMGAGIGMGLGMAKQISDAMSGAPASPAAPAAVGTCPSCNTALPAGAKFCPGCGQKIAVAAFCISCGKQMPAGSKFCPECGAKQGE